MNKKHIVGIGVVFVLIAIYVGIKMYASNVAEKKIDKAIAEFANYADVDYKNVSVDLFGLNVHVSNVVISPAGSKDKVKINEIVLYDIDEKSDIPTFLNGSLNGIEIAIDELGSDVQKIKELGYNDKILLNLAIEYNYKKEENELSLRNLRIGAENAGDLEVSFRLGNVDLSSDKIMSILFTYPKIMLYEAKLSYNDDSLVERILKLAAKEQNKSIEQVKNDAIKEIENEIKKEKDKFTKNALKEVKDFVNAPDNFSISISPQKPLPLGRIMRVNDPKDLIKLMNVKIKS